MISISVSFHLAGSAEDINRERGDFNHERSGAEPGEAALKSGGTGAVVGRDLHGGVSSNGEHVEHFSFLSG